MVKLVPNNNKRPDTCFKMRSVGGAGTPGVKEMFGETKRVQQLMDHSLSTEKSGQRTQSRGSTHIHKVTDAARGGV